VHAKLPEKPNFFEYFYNKEKMMFVNWIQTVPAFLLPKNISYNDLLIPTIDSIRNNYFLHQNIKNKMHILFSGPTGTGKSVQILNELYTNYYNQTYTFLSTAFSGQTVANQVQRLIESKVCTRRRKGVFGPEEGKSEIVVFIDDLNMPQKEKYGAQPPIELLRQWMDTGGWYDLDTKEWKLLCDINFVAAMLPSVGGRNVVTMRYLRHYNLIYVEPFEADSLVKIFGSVLEWYFMNLPQALPKAITNLKDNVVASTIELYNKVQTSKELLPTPAKSHYIYNLRDLSKVFQGITKATGRALVTENDFIKLWAHECSRIFKDRLINVEDQTFFDNMLKDIVKSNFRKEWSQLVTVEPLLWASFIPTIYPDGDTTKKPLNDVYCELTNREVVKKKCYEYLDEYNNFYTGNRMNLVLFMAAI
jgi:dynein heavy chain